MPKITIEEMRKILGPESDSFDDKRMTLLREFFYEVANNIIDEVVKQQQTTPHNIENV